MQKHDCRPTTGPQPENRRLPNLPYFLRQFEETLLRGDSVLIHRTPFPRRVTRRMAEQWADNIRPDAMCDPRRPDFWEWRETPIIKADLGAFSYGVVYIKDEGTNVFGTSKARLAWEAIKPFGLQGREIVLQTKPNRNPTHYSLITNGNSGATLAQMSALHGTPPLNMLIHYDLTERGLEYLKTQHANLFIADLSSRPLSGSEILRLTRNPNGIELTSEFISEAHANLYDWHVHEVFNRAAEINPQGPLSVYVPYGTGRLFENYALWQRRTARNDFYQTKDPRLKTSPESVYRASIRGSAPVDEDSVAQMLTCKFNPYVRVQQVDVQTLLEQGHTGPKTGIVHVDESYIVQAHRIMNRFVKAEPSAAASLALYMQDFDRALEKTGKPPEGIALIVSTGCGQFYENTRPQ